MPKRSSTKRKPKKAEGSDVNEIAASIVDAVTSDNEEEEQREGRNPAAVALGRLGGKKGGPARAKKLSKARRKEIAKKAATERWKSHNTDA